MESILIVTMIPDSIDIITITIVSIIVVVVFNMILDATVVGNRIF